MSEKLKSVGARQKKTSAHIENLPHSASGVYSNGQLVQLLGPPKFILWLAMWILNIPSMNSWTPIDLKIIVCVCYF